MTDSSVDYRLIDSTLRDGSHAISHQYDEDDVIAIVREELVLTEFGRSTAYPGGKNMVTIPPSNNLLEGSWDSQFKIAWDKINAWIKKT